jgi:hypothetical protein
VFVKLWAMEEASTIITTLQNLRDFIIYVRIILRSGLGEEGVTLLVSMSIDYTI